MYIFCNHCDLQNKIAFTFFKSQLEVYFPVFFLIPLPLKDFTIFIHVYMMRDAVYFFFFIGFYKGAKNTIWPKVCEYLTVTSHLHMSLAQTVAATMEIVFPSMTMALCTEQGL